MLVIILYQYDFEDILRKMHNQVINSQAINKLVNKAIEVAEYSDFSYKHGAIMFSCRNNIVCSGFNQYGTTKLLNFCVPSLHAEAHCLKIMLRRRDCFKEPQFQFRM